MKTFISICLVALSLSIDASAQGKPPSNLPYYEIPDYPETYTSGTVAARVIDGLGFRYYWATEGLRKEDLSYKPSADARTTEETLVHIYQLTWVIVNTAKNLPVEFNPPKFSFEELRKKTLENIKSASDILKSSKENDLNETKMVFKGPNGNTEFPFWNLLNGPIDDALWHVGQVVSFRRSSGNPFNSNASVLVGKLIEPSSGTPSKE